MCIHFAEEETLRDVSGWLSDLKSAAKFSSKAGQKGTRIGSAQKQPIFQEPAKCANRTHRNNQGNNGNRKDTQ